MTDKTEKTAKTEWVINGTKVEESTKLKFAENPKREGSKAHTRYEQYSKAKTWGQYLKVAEPKFAMADARYDLQKEFLKIES